MSSSSGSPRSVVVCCSDFEGGVVNTTATTDTMLQLTKAEPSSWENALHSPHSIVGKGKHFAL